MKCILATLALVVSAAATAQTPYPTLDYLPLDSTAHVQVPDTLARHTVRQATLDEAAALLKRADTGLRPYAVTGPSCRKDDTHKTCKTKTKACEKAKSFAKKYSLHVMCSALYDQATILLTTVPAPSQETAGVSPVDAGSENSERGNSPAVPQ